MLVSLPSNMLQNCHKGSLGLSFFIPKMLRHQHIWEAWCQLQCSVPVSCSPWLHGPAKLAEVRHGLSCVDERWKWFWASYSIHQTGEFEGQTAVSLFAPSCQAQLYMASNTSETWDTTLQLATKGLLASGALLREPSCLFRDTRETSPCFHMKDPRGELPCPSEERQSTNHAHPASQRSPIPFTPELAACYLLLQHPCMGS